MQVQGNQRVYTGVWQVHSRLRYEFSYCYVGAPTFKSFCDSCSILMQGLVLMAKKEGLRGMFKGNWTNCVRIIPNSAVKFLTYEQLSRCQSVHCTTLSCLSRPPKNQPAFYPFLLMEKQTMPERQYCADLRLRHCHPACSLLDQKTL